MLLSKNCQNGYNENCNESADEMSCVHTLAVQISLRHCRTNSRRASPLLGVVEALRAVF